MKRSRGIRCADRSLTDLTGALYVFLAVAGLLLPVPSALAQQAVISGTVTDSVSNTPLVHANIALENRPRGATTSSSGRYEITGLPPGRYTLVHSYVGYQTHRQTVEVTSGEHRRMNVQLAPVRSNIDEVVVRGEDSGAFDSEIGAAELKARDLEQIPSALESDVFRSLQHLPGVKASSDFSSGLYIRGSSPSHTLVQLGHATIYNPSHVLGFFSTFNPSAVDKVQLHKGAYPVAYGGRLGSVVKVENKGGSSKNLDGEAQIGLLSGRAMAEGPHPHGTWMIAARRSTMEPVLHRLNARDIKGVPQSFHFYDVNASLNFRLTPDDRLSTSVFHGRDDMHFPFSTNLLFDVDYGNTAASISWKHVAGSSLLTEIAAAGSWYSSSSEALLTRTPFARNNEIMDLTLTGKLDYIPDGPHELQAGFETRQYRFFVHDRNAERTKLKRSSHPRYGAIYLKDVYQPTDRWRIIGGARMEYFSAGNHLRFSPRLALQFHPLADLQLQTAAGRYRQFITRNNSQLLASFDTWLPASNNVSPSAANHVTGGFTWKPEKHLKISLDGYLRTMDNLFRLDPRRPDATGIPYHELFLSGEGYAYGTELMVQKSSGWLMGMVSYTYGKTRRRFSTLNDGQYFAPRHDRTHDINVNLRADISDGWQTSVLFSYATGQPYTRPVRQYVLRDSPYMGHHHAVFVSHFNDARLPAYHRLDMGITRKGNLAAGIGYEARFQVVNVLGHDNPWFDLYGFTNRYEITRRRMPQIPVALPNVSFGLQF